jgi:hypothetical protein
MKILNRPNVIHVPTAMKDMKVGEQIAIPYKVASEAKVRHLCTKAKAWGSEFVASITAMPDAIVITKLK